MKLSAKSRKFNNVLLDAKDALDSIGIPFHLHSGTALGAEREKDFIKHDHDIDLAVFYEDVNTASKVKAIEKAMKHAGFYVNHRLGTLPRGKEIQFIHEKTDIPLDIFWVYKGKYKGKEYYINGLYYGICDNYKYKMCVYGVSPYKPKTIILHGTEYKTIPVQTIVDLYGKDWKTPKKFSYEQGLSEEFKGFIPDFFEPKDIDTKIAFCFLLYDTVKHRKIWEEFFNQDRGTEKSYNIYTHLKQVTNKTPDWVERNQISNIKTGWCEENLVWAWINLLKEAYKDPKNKYFCILSGECIPLFDYDTTYRKITGSKKSRINIDYNHVSWIEKRMYYADQWIILTRETAKKLIELKDTAKGKEWLKKTRKQMCMDDEDWCFCPDEIYPINWFVYNYGPPSSRKFRSKFKLGPSTYTYWEDGPHPIKFTKPKVEKMKADICKSGALFGRKFYGTAAKELAMKC